MCDVEKVMDKIKKLLALGQSPNENEASNAMAKAEALLMEHNLQMEDLGDEESSNIIQFDITGERSGVAKWDQYLMSGIARSLNCRMMRQRYTNMKGTMRQRWIMIGTEADTAVGKYLYEYLLDAMKTMANVQMRWNPDLPTFYTNNQRKTYRESYLYGLAVTVIEKVRAKYAEQVHETEEIYALVRKKDKAVQDYLDSLNTKSMTNRRHSINGSAYNSGKEDGARIGVNRAVKSDSGQRSKLLN